MTEYEFLNWVFCHSSALRAFRVYCRSRAADEVLDFLLAVNRYQGNANKKKAIEIIDLFVNGDRMVNFDDPLVRDLTQKRDRYADLRTQAKQKSALERWKTSAPRKADPRLFDEAKATARKLLVEGILTPWILTREGKVWFQYAEQTSARDTAKYNNLMNVMGQI